MTPFHIIGLVLLVGWPAWMVGVGAGVEHATGGLFTTISTGFLRLTLAFVIYAALKGVGVPLP